MRPTHRSAQAAWALAALLAAAAPAAPAGPQPWACKLFEQTSHDFGVVARGATMEHRFRLQNVRDDDVRIAAVRASCSGCTATEITRRRLKPSQTAEIVATLDTRRFLGRNDSTLTVVFDLPFPAEVQLQVQSYVRSDVVVEPGAVQFGSVPRATGVERRVTVRYAGRADWAIDAVECASPFIETRLAESSRDSGQVSYELTVRLSEAAPVGTLGDRLILVTNDENPQAARVPVAIEGEVLSPVSVRPSPLMLGVVAPGRSVTRPMVVRAESAFRITAVECDDPHFTFDVPGEAKRMHLMPVTFTAGPDPGPVAGTVRVTTDLGADGVSDAALHAIVADRR